MEKANLSYYVVIPNKHPELADRLIKSIYEHETQVPPIIVVADNHAEEFQGAKTVTVREPFVFARNVNIGLRQLEDSDVVVMNDDTVLVAPVLNRLAEVASPPNWGIVAPMIDGGVGNPYQSYWMKASLYQFREEFVEMYGTDFGSPVICFVCAYLKRRMIRQIGGLDEKFEHYGFDDNDYCIRARKAGWKTVIWGAGLVRHGEGGSELIRGRNWSCSFVRKQPAENNLEYFQKKHRSAK